LSDDPDAVELPRDHGLKMIKLCAELLPAVTKTDVHSTWYAVRPLIAQGKPENPQEISRDFDCYDHRQRDNLDGLISVIGGKATTLRLMAEKAVDLICRKTGRNLACKTKTEKLLHYRNFYK
jgi:glycerol-3-phosphate dehydrogenase